MLSRTDYLTELQSLLNQAPIVAILGARQVGKTTLAKMLAASFGNVTFFDLENPANLSRLSDPMLALEPLTGLVIIDEIQHQPELFRVLRVLADRQPLTCRFLVLGSASKRQVKAPKVYLNDSGILHALLGLDSLEVLENHPKVGASWEGFALNTVITQLKIQPEEAFFWGTYSGAELDLLVIHGNTRLGLEFKRTVMPKISKSLMIAIEDLKLTHAFIIYAGDSSFPLATNITAVSLRDVPDKLSPIS